MRRLFLTIATLTLVACGSKAEIGDPCTTDEDCGDLECHLHDGESEGFCDTEDHEDAHDEDHEDHNDM